MVSKVQSKHRFDHAICDADRGEPSYKRGEPYHLYVEVIEERQQPPSAISPDVVEAPVMRSPESLVRRDGDKQPTTRSHELDKRASGGEILAHMFEHIERHHEVE